MKTVWIGQREDGAFSTGTSADPLDARDADSFDALLRKVPERSVIRLLPGNYETKGFAGGVVVKNGWRIVGSGMGNTTIKLMAVNKGWNTALFSGWGGPVSHVSIEDLTVDCNHAGIAEAIGSPDFTTQAIYLAGDNLRVERVRAIGAAGLRDSQGGKLNPESFVIVVGPHKATELPWGYRIRDCEVSEFAGGTCTAITITAGGARPGATGVISGCRVKLAGPGQFAYSGYDCGGIVIEGNLSIGAGRGINWDTGQGRNLIIRGNLFLEQVGIGALLGGSADGVFENNLIELTGENSSGVILAAKGTELPGASGWTIRNNIIRNRSEGKNFSVQFVNGIVPAGCVFEGNLFDESLSLGKNVQVERS